MLTSPDMPRIQFSRAALLVRLYSQRSAAGSRIRFETEQLKFNGLRTLITSPIFHRALSSFIESSNDALDNSFKRKSKKLLEPSHFDSVVTFEEAFGRKGISQQLWPAQVTRLLQSFSRRGLAEATYDCIEQAMSRGLALQPWHFAIAMTACNKGNRSDLSLLLRKKMLASGVGATPLVHAASLPNLQADEAINLARDLEASDVVHPARDPWFYVALVQTLFLRSNPDAAMSEFESAMSRGLLPSGVAIVSPAATGSAATGSDPDQAEPRRNTHLFDAVWSSVIEGLGRNGQPERANKAFEEMLERLSSDTTAAALAFGRRIGWRSRQVDSASRRDPRLFDAYLRAASSAQFLFPHVLEIFDIMSSYRCSPSTHTYCAYIACCCKFSQFPEAEQRFDEFMAIFASSTRAEQHVERTILSAPAAAAVEAVAGAAFKALAYRTSKRSAGDRHLAWQLAQHILLRSILSGASLSPRSLGWMVAVAAEINVLQGGFIKSFMDSVVPLVRDKSLLVSSEGIAAMTRHMCEKGNGNAAIDWLLTCRGAGSSIDQRWVGRALVACASQGPKSFTSATNKLISSGLPPSAFEGDAATLFVAATQAAASASQLRVASLSEQQQPR